MKTKLTFTALFTGLLLSLTSAPPARAGSAVAAPHEKSLSGTVVSVDQDDRTIRVKTFWNTKLLNLGNDCQVSLQDKPQASTADLRPGQTVEIRYQSAQGVLVAHRIGQFNQTYAGRIQSIDPTGHVTTVRHRLLDKDFQIAEDCRVMVADGKSGALSDLKRGHRVMLVYETPAGKATVHRIIQASRTFNGTLTAIDLNDHTLKAKTLLGSKSFSLANDCQIVINDKLDGALRDLRIGDRVVFNYDDVDGVLVANRVSRQSAAAPENVSAKGAEYSDSRPVVMP